MKKMKKIFNLIFVILFSAFFAVCAEAAFLPVEENFDDNKLSEVFSYNIPSDFSLEATDGALKVSKGTTWNKNDFDISLSLSPSVIGKKAFLSFDVLFGENTNPYTPYGFPAITDKSGNTKSLLKFYSGALYNGNSFTDAFKFADFTLECNVEYKFKAVLDLEKNTYSIYYDKGEGETLLKYSDGTSEFPLPSDTLSKVSFTSQGGWYAFNYLTLDNIKLTADDTYIYVSPSGNDENEGTKENPLKTPDKAYEKAKALKTVDNQNVYVMLMEGEYSLDENYTYSEISSYKNPGNIVFYPVFGDKVRINGDFSYDLSALNLSEYESEYILNKLKNDNIGYYKGHPLSFSDADFDIDIENSAVDINVDVLNSSYYDAKVSLIMCAYTSGGALKSISSSDFSIKKESKDTLKLSISGKGVSYIKAYIWDDESGMKPLHSAFLYEGEKELNIITLDSSIELSEAYVKEGKLCISCNETDKKRVTLKITDASERTLYFDQINLKNDTSFEKEIPLGSVNISDDILSGSYVLTIRGSN